MYAKGNTPGARNRLQCRMQQLCGPLATVDVHQTQTSPRSSLQMGILVRCTICPEDTWWVNGINYREVAAEWTAHLAQHQDQPPTAAYARKPHVKPVYVGLPLTEAATKTGLTTKRLRSLIRQGVLHNYGSNTTPRVDPAQLSLVQWDRYRTT